MIAGPVSKLSTPEGTVLVSYDAADDKYILWGEFNRITLDQLRAMAMDELRAEQERREAGAEPATT